MKTKLTLFLFLFTVCSQGFGQASVNPVVDVILRGYSVRTFSTVPVTDQQTDLILKCGIKAPSARNLQPWRFTIVKDLSLLGDVIPNVTQGNILIVISGAENQQAGINVDFDCALATENMYIAAQGLGLGAHIYAGPVGRINTEKKSILGIPDGFRAVAVLRVGNIDSSVDAVSSASARKKAEEIINYR